MTFPIGILGAGISHESLSLFPVFFLGLMQRTHILVCSLPYKESWWGRLLVWEAWDLGFPLQSKKGWVGRRGLSSPYDFTYEPQHPVYKASSFISNKVDMLIFISLNCMLMSKLDLKSERRALFMDPIKSCLGHPWILVGLSKLYRKPLLQGLELIFLISIFISLLNLYMIALWLSYRSLS